MGVMANKTPEPNMDQLNNENVSSSNPVLDIVNELQTKLNENNNATSTIKENFFNSKIINNSEQNKDLSGLDISKILEIFNTMNKNNSNDSNKLNDLNTMNINNSSGLNLDLGSIMNFKNLLGSISQNDPRQELLTSLKPFLRETRQRNIDTYITLLGVMKAFNIFTNKDRD